MHKHVRTYKHKNMHGNMYASMCTNKHQTTKSMLIMSSCKSIGLYGNCSVSQKADKYNGCIWLYFQTQQSNIYVNKLCVYF